MAELKRKVKNALDEGRILVLGAQVLLGFQFRSVFEKKFETLSPLSQYLETATLGLMLVALALLLFPAAYHCIVERGEDTERAHRFTTKVMEFALLPFAVSLAANFYIVTERLVSLSGQLLFGGAALATSLFFWYGLEYIDKRKAEPMPSKLIGNPEQSPAPAKTPIKNKIQHVLTEARMILPGAQALLGFQFATFLMEGFDRLPSVSKFIHLASLSFISLSAVFLMTPAAYHRSINGEETEAFHQFASRMLLSAMSVLAIGIAGRLLHRLGENNRIGAPFGLHRFSFARSLFLPLVWIYPLQKGPAGTPPSVD